MNVLKVLTRIYLEPDKLDDTISFYEDLFQEKCVTRFKYPPMNLELAGVSSVLLIAGTEEALAPVKKTQMTLRVDSVVEFHEKFAADGLTILDGPREVPTGFNMHVQHPDGSIVEYVEHRKH